VAHLAEPLAGALDEAGLRVVTAPVPPGEESKSLAEVERLCRLAARAGLRRADAVLAMGGGVVGDLAGFVAASYQRGVRLAHLPTTLLAMVDSAIGGKTGVDLPEAKNYVGAVWQPELVVMDTDTLRTLPARELACGFAEVVKTGLLNGPELFATVESWSALPGPDEPLAELIRSCVSTSWRSWPPTNATTGCGRR
jgi:3-dehydroquinate synthase